MTLTDAHFRVAQTIAWAPDTVLSPALKASRFLNTLRQFFLVLHPLDTVCETSLENPDTVIFRVPDGSVTITLTTNPDTEKGGNDVS